MTSEHGAGFVASPRWCELCWGHSSSPSSTHLYLPWRLWITPPAKRSQCGCTLPCELTRPRDSHPGSNDIRAAGDPCPSLFISGLRGNGAVAACVLFSCSPAGAAHGIWGRPAEIPTAQTSRRQRHKQSCAWSCLRAGGCKKSPVPWVSLGWFGVLLGCYWSRRCSSISLQESFPDPSSLPDSCAVQGHSVPRAGGRGCCSHGFVGKRLCDSRLCHHSNGNRNSGLSAECLFG